MYAGLIRVFCLLLVGSLVPAVAIAAESQAVEPLSIQSVSQVVFGLIFVIVLILFLAWALRRLNAVPGQTGAMRVITSMPIGARERIVLVQVGEEQLLLGVTGQSVNLLARYEEPIVSPEQVNRGEFAERLAQVLQNRGSK